MRIETDQFKTQETVTEDGGEDRRPAVNEDSWLPNWLLSAPSAPINAGFTFYVG
jgi:hypothetical protein